MPPVRLASHPTQEEETPTPAGSASSAPAAKKKSNEKKKKPRNAIRPGQGMFKINKVPERRNDEGDENLWVDVDDSGDIPDYLKLTDLATLAAVVEDGFRVPLRPYVDNEARQMSTNNTNHSGPSQTTPVPPGWMEYYNVNVHIKPGPFPPPAVETLRYSSREAAAAGVPGPTWMPPSPDSTIPMNDEENAYYVRRIYDAMLCRDYCREKQGQIFKRRWGAKSEPMPEYYQEPLVELVCWHLLEITLNLHRLGPRTLNIHDPAFQVEVLKTKNYTFLERAKIMCQALLLSKTRCDMILKGEQREVFVSAPQTVLHGIPQNYRQNSRRQGTIIKGKDLAMQKMREAGEQNWGDKTKLGRKRKASEMVEEQGGVDEGVGWDIQADFELAAK